MTHTPKGRAVDGDRPAPASRDSTPTLKCRSLFLMCSRGLANSYRITMRSLFRNGLARLIKRILYRDMAFLGRAGDTRLLELACEVRRRSSRAVSCASQPSRVA